MKLERPRHHDGSAVCASQDLTELFRQSFRRLAGGVVVLTFTDDSGEPVGFTATSFASLSASPARATFNVIRSSSSYPALREGRRITVSFLGAKSSDIGLRFAGPADQRFEGDHWTERDGAPVLRDAAVVLDTSVERIIELDENAIVVLSIAGGEVGAEIEPLLYFNREFVTTRAAS